MNKKAVNELLLLFVAFVWGTTFVIVQNAIHVLPPLTFNAIRFFLAGFFLLPIVPFLKKKEQGRQTEWIRTILSGVLLGIFLFLGYSLQTIGLQYTTPSKAGFITGLSVVLVPLLSVFVIGKKPAPLALAGAGLSAIGLYFLSAGPSFSVNKGDLFILICAFGFTMHIISTGAFTSKFSPLLLTLVQLFTVGILCSLGAILTEDWMTAFQLPVLLSPEVLMALLITSFLATSAAFLIQTYSQKHTSPTRVAIIFTMEPVFAALSSYFMIHEHMTLLAWLGGVFIVAGMLIAELPVIAKSGHSQNEDSQL